MGKMNGKRVQCLTNDRLVRGVVTGIPVNVSVDEFKTNITNVKVKDVKRMKSIPEMESTVTAYHY